MLYILPHDLSVERGHIISVPSQSYITLSLLPSAVQTTLYPIMRHFYTYTTPLPTLYLYILRQYHDLQDRFCTWSVAEFARFCTPGSHLLLLPLSGRRPPHHHLCPLPHPTTWAGACPARPTLFSSFACGPLDFHTGRNARHARCILHSSYMDCCGRFSATRNALRCSRYLYHGIRFTLTHFTVPVHFCHCLHSCCHHTCRRIMLRSRCALSSYTPHSSHLPAFLSSFYIYMVVGYRLDADPRFYTRATTGRRCWLPLLFSPMIDFRRWCVDDLIFVSPSLGVYVVLLRVVVPVVFVLLAPSFYDSRYIRVVAGVVYVVC